MCSWASTAPPGDIYFYCIIVFPLACSAPVPKCSLISHSLCGKTPRECISLLDCIEWSRRHPLIYINTNSLWNLAFLWRYQSVWYFISFTSTGITDYFTDEGTQQNFVYLVSYEFELFIFLPSLMVRMKSSWQGLERYSISFQLTLGKLQVFVKTLIQWQIK